jgi:DNA invertase Pin-like site-specific DNA recombinase
VSATTTSRNTEGASGRPSAVLDQLVVVYERVSTDRQDLARQAMQRDRARADYGTDPHVITDDGVSAFKVPIKERPGGSQLWALIDAGQVAAVYVDAQDRLSRGADPLEWVTFQAMCASKKTRIIVDGNELANDLSGKVLGYLRDVLATQESEEKSHRVKTGKEVNVRRGRPNGGKRRFGFERGAGKTGRIVPRPDELAVVVRMHREYADGVSQKDIAKGLNKDGITTSTGRAWNQSQISQILHDPIWEGRRVTKFGELPANIEHDGPLVPTDLRDKVRGRIPQRGTWSRGRPSMHFLLGNGLLRCGQCGAKMRVCRDLKQYGWYESYRCNGRDQGSTDCDMPGVLRSQVDPAFFTYWAQMVLDVDGTIDQLARNRERQLANVEGRADNARAVIARVEAQLERLDTDYRNGDLTVKEWRELAAPPKAELKAAKGALRDLAKQERAVRDQGVQLDATAEVVEALTTMRAQVAGEINEAADLREAQATIRRVFDHIVLNVQDGEAFLVPVLKADCVFVPDTAPDAPWEPEFDGDLTIDAQVPADAAGTCKPRRVPMRLSKTESGP